jgi:hypothetical protein
MFCLWLVVRTTYRLSLAYESTVIILWPSITLLIVFVCFFRHSCPCIFSSSRLNSHIILWRTLHSAQPPLGTSATGFFPVHDRLYRPSWSAELSTLLSSRYFEAIPLQGQWTRLSSDRTYENWHFYSWMEPPSRVVDRIPYHLLYSPSSIQNVFVSVSTHPKYFLFHTLRPFRSKDSERM